jgi:hypothetical protein
MNNQQDWFDGFLDWLWKFLTVAAAIWMINILWDSWRNTHG